MDFTERIPTYKHLHISQNGGEIARTMRRTRTVARRTEGLSFIMAVVNYRKFKKENTHTHTHTYMNTYTYTWLDCKDSVFHRRFCPRGQKRKAISSSATTFITRRKCRKIPP